jgi:hypothetical protein
LIRFEMPESSLKTDPNMKVPKVQLLQLVFWCYLESGVRIEDFTFEDWLVHLRQLQKETTEMRWTLSVRRMEA